MDLVQKNKLLYARAGFGISPDRYKSPLPINEAVSGLFPSAMPGAIEVVTQDEWAQQTPKAMREMKQSGDMASVKLSKHKFVDQLHDLNRGWLDEMVTTQHPLLEKTALFWHGHFATRTNNAYYDQLLLQVIRANSLGSFRVLLNQVSKSSAMLQFLNNQQNNKRHPNENFAREVMELFTLGRGNYTEQDVKEAARAFTGWTFDDLGSFSYRAERHDEGEKTFLGKKGPFNGDDIINRLLDQRQTAKFITTKLYGYFVSDERIDERCVADLAKDFYESDYDISRLLNKMFTADWFYGADVPGSKVKSPIELIVGYRRLVSIDFGDFQPQLKIQRMLGQELFRPPNVGGWRGGLSWIDSSSLLVRMGLPEMLLGGKDLNLKPKEPEAETPLELRVANDANLHNGPAKITVDWTKYAAAWQDTRVADLPRVLSDYLLAQPLAKSRLKEVESLVENHSAESRVKALTLLFTGLPEYQLC